LYEATLLGPFGAPFLLLEFRSAAVRLLRGTGESALRGRYQKNYSSPVPENLSQEWGLTKRKIVSFARREHYELNRVLLNHLRSEFVRSCRI